MSVYLMTRHEHIGPFHTHGQAHGYAQQTGRQSYQLVPELPPHAHLQAPVSVSAQKLMRTYRTDHRAAFLHRPRLLDIAV
ncbi:hypothetical protein [Bradyrhizobium sp. SZCCHNS3053]|uniref:hypothetical protein n=1 Tax=Bradyrhizobium sp. SZCCHNS3053 TaxID=3057322 RepID=UPI0029165CB8|nr:hypothetical protein [Bradyrhizobium sp. SZCCHNS3053]